MITIDISETIELPDEAGPALDHMVNVTIHQIGPTGVFEPVLVASHGQLRAELRIAAARYLRNVADATARFKRRAAAAQLIAP